MTDQDRLGLRRRRLEERRGIAFRPFAQQGITVSRCFAGVVDAVEVHATRRLQDGCDQQEPQAATLQSLAHQLPPPTLRSYCARNASTASASFSASSRWLSALVM